MILTIDVGNTNIVLGVWEDDRLCFVSRFKTDRAKTEDEYAIDLKNVLALYHVELGSVTGAAVSSVVSQITGAISRAVEKLTGKVPLLIGPGVRTGLNIQIENPAQLGSDMVVDAVGAMLKYPRPVIIIDMGTATKIFAVDKAGNFPGCAIMPGVRIGLDALAEQTSTLPKIALEAPDEVIGKNSEESMKSGVVLGTASMIDGMVERFEKELGQAAAIVATGGYSGDVVPYCGRSVIHDPHLTLEGLYRIYLKNRPPV